MKSKESLRNQKFLSKGQWMLEIMSIFREDDKEWPQPDKVGR